MLHTYAKVGENGEPGLKGPSVTPLDTKFVSTVPFACKRASPYRFVPTKVKRPPIRIFPSA